MELPSFDDGFGEQECEAVKMEDEEQNDLLVHGFLRKSMKKSKMNIPFALINLITIWHSIEYVHVMSNAMSDYEDENKFNHWKINVDKIFNEF